MGASGLVTMVGDGSDGSAGHQVFVALDWWIDTPGQAQLIGVTHPYRVMHAGWIAIGWGAGYMDPGPQPSVAWWQYLDFDQRQIVFPSPVEGNAIIWSIPAGVAAKAEWYW